MKYQEEPNRRGSAEKKLRNQHRQSMANNVLDSDRDRDDVSQDDAQIIIKTDKHSQQRAVKKDIFESDYNNDSRTEPTSQPQAINQSRDSHNRDKEPELRRNQSQNYNKPEESYDNESQ